MSTLREERAVTVFGVPARAFAVIAAADGRILNQTIKARRDWQEAGDSYSLTVSLRFDDECRNGHESFSITADLKRNGLWEAGGCLHEDIAERFPEFAGLIQWHLCSTDGPAHYVANTVYLAGDRDYNGLRKDERRQIRNGGTQLLCWRRVAVARDGTEIPLYTLSKYCDSDTRPADDYALAWRPWYCEGEGKAREFDAARRAAVWPDATDAELSQEPEALKAALLTRLPKLLQDFRTEMTAVGFIYPPEVLS